MRFFTATSTSFFENHESLVVTGNEVSFISIEQDQNGQGTLHRLPDDSIIYVGNDGLIQSSPYSWQEYQDMCWDIEEVV